MRKYLRAALAVLALLLCSEAIDLGWLAHSRATVSSSLSKIVDIGDGSTTVFSFPFIGVQASDITVIYTDASGNETTLSQGTQYTISLNVPTTGSVWGVGGTVTYPLSGSPIAAGTSITIERNVPYTQTASSNNGQLFPVIVETALDLLDMQIQQIQSVVGRSISVSATDTCGALGSLPNATQRANQLLGFDSTGCNPIVAQPSSAPVSSAMQPVVDAATIPTAVSLLGISTIGQVPVGAELDWPSLTAPAYWKLEDGSAVSRTTYSALLAVLAPVVPCTITSGSATITGISSTVGWAPGWTIESPGSSALGSGITIATVGASSITINGGTPSANATSCEIFPYGTAQDGTFNLPNAAGVVYAGIDTNNANLNSTYCAGNPGRLNAACGNQSTALGLGNLPNIPVVSSITTPPTYGNAGNTTLTFGQGSGGSVSVFGPPGDTANVDGGVITSTIGGTNDTPFSALQPTRIRNKIIYAGAP